MENDKIEKFKCDILGEIGWPESHIYPKQSPKSFLTGTVWRNIESNQESSSSYPRLLCSQREPERGNMIAYMRGEVRFQA